MNNKSVAWMMVNRENTSAYLTFDKPTRDMKISHEPHELYTHPVKELTDEEIEECCCFLDVRLHHRYEPNAVVKDIEWTVTGIKDFVKAILRKAQEADKIESLGTVNIGGVHYRNGKEVK